MEKKSCVQKLIISFSLRRFYDSFQISLHQRSLSMKFKIHFDTWNRHSKRMEIIIIETWKAIVWSWGVVERKFKIVQVNKEKRSNFGTIFIKSKYNCNKNNANRRKLTVLKIKHEKNACEPFFDSKWARRISFRDWWKGTTTMVTMKSWWKCLIAKRLKKMTKFIKKSKNMRKSLRRLKRIMAICL